MVIAIQYDNYLYFCIEAVVTMVVLYLCVNQLRGNCQQ